MRAILGIAWSLLCILGLPAGRKPRSSLFPSLSWTTACWGVGGGFGLILGLMLLPRASISLSKQDNSAAQLPCCPGVS